MADSEMVARPRYMIALAVGEKTTPQTINTWSFTVRDTDPARSAAPSLLTVLSAYRRKKSCAGPSDTTN